MAGIAYIITVDTLLPVPLNLLAKSAMDLARLPRLRIRVEHQINFLERPLRRLGIQEEHVDCHDGTKHAEDDVGLPLDVGKGRGDKVRQCKVEDPVACRGQSHTLGAVLQREDFRCVNPCCRGPGETVYADKDVRERNDGLAWRPGDLPLEAIVAVDAVDGVAAGGHDGGDGVVDDHADDGAGQQQQAPTDAVDVGEDDAGRDDEDDVLDDGGVERGITALHPLAIIFKRKRHTIPAIWKIQTT